ncbi:4352_t:CDS:2, partial [Cetraspora pellucida]
KLNQHRFHSPAANLSWSSMDFKLLKNAARFEQSSLPQQQWRFTGDLLVGDGEKIQVDEIDQSDLVPCQSAVKLNLPDYVSVLALGGGVYGRQLEDLKQELHVSRKAEFAAESKVKKLQAKYDQLCINLEKLENEQQGSRKSRGKLEAVAMLRESK